MTHISEVLKQIMKNLEDRMPLYDHDFDELFESKRQAVVSFLSLERRYMALHKQFSDLNREIDINYDRKSEYACTYFNDNK